MWHEISNAGELSCFMEEMDFFHDSCVKEMKYVSGAYVESNLSMKPINDKRILKVLIERQYEKLTAIEPEFEGLQYLKLFPVGCEYSCEISDSSAFFENGYIYWCDCGDLTKNDLENYNGTVICASKLRWRAVEKRF